MRLPRGAKLGVASKIPRYCRNKSESTVAEKSRQSAKDVMAESKSLQKEVATPRRANETPMTASLFRSQIQPDTALITAYIDEHRSCVTAPNPWRIANR